jgi:AcrR family transcriptional regulator
MARKPSTTKQDILDNCEVYLAACPAHSLTARALANFMDISTFPIYYYFESMSDLKIEVFKQIFSHVSSEMNDESFHHLVHQALMIVDTTLNYPILVHEIYREILDGKDHFSQALIELLDKSCVLSGKDCSGMHGEELGDIAGMIIAVSSMGLFTSRRIDHDNLIEMFSSLVSDVNA